MLEKIAQVTGLKYNANDAILNSVLTRIQRKLPIDLTEHSQDIDTAILQAEKAVNAEGQIAIVNIVKVLSAEPAAKELKIKSSPKGNRLKEPAANGVRYSFGPVWNESVRAARGIAVSAQNREKLLHQAELAGISSAAELSITELCAAISATF